MSRQPTLESARHQQHDHATRRQVLLGAACLCAARVDNSRAQPRSPAAETATGKLIQAARAQIGVTTSYDPSYQRLGFPGGDVAAERGVCSDVVVRAYRAAFNADLQALLNADMRQHFSAYPKRWGLAGPDPNIDHRRVLNLEVFFRRQGAALPIPSAVTDWQPGDVVAQTLPQGLPHIGIVSDTRDGPSGQLLVIHNIGRGTEASDILTTFKTSGRYRYLTA